MKMWDGRFLKPIGRLMEVFNSSLPVDQMLIMEDIAGSAAWAHALHKAKVLSKRDNDKIQIGLESIRADWEKGILQFPPSDEDIHTAVERLLVERIGEPGARLHTGRSRNDQVATDFRLFVKNSLGEIHNQLLDLQRTLLRRAHADRDTIIPGYTHLQQAQPVVLAHYWLSFLFLLERDKTRCLNAIDSADVMPLGSGAIAGSGFNVDRNAIAGMLGFSAVSDNSIDGVASRDFALEALSVIMTIAINLSRYAEDLIIWSSQEFSFVELDDAWSTGSSMMPQKKNPDSLELIRGKCGRFIGNLTRCATTLKGVGLSYYKDLQEDKEPVIDSVRQIVMVLAVFSRVIATLKVKPENIREKMDSLLYATDIADYLVKKKMPFRTAHKIVGNIVAHCISSSISLDALPLAKFREYSELFTNDVFSLFSWKAALAHRDVYGGTGPKSIKKQLEKAKILVQ